MIAMEAGIGRVRSDSGVMEADREDIYSWQF